MKRIEDFVIEKGRWSDITSLDNAQAMFEIGKMALVLPSKSSKGYTARDGQLAWRTVLKKLEDNKRQKGIRPVRRSKRARPDDENDEGDEQEGEERDDDDDDDVDDGDDEVAHTGPPRKRGTA